MRNLNRLELKLFLNILQSDPSPLRKYLLDRGLRKLTEKNQSWPVTKLVYKTLNDNNLWSDDYITKSKIESNINKKLKKLGVEGIYFEHWKEISEMIKELLDLDFPNDREKSITKLEKYLIKNTDCFFRLKRTEDHLQPHFQEKHWRDLI